MAGLGGVLAGCLGSEPAVLDDPPTGTPAAECRRGRTRMDQPWHVESGPLGGVALTLDRETVPVGGSLTARLRNVSDEERVTGNRHKYDVERETAEGWRSVLWRDEDAGWTDEGIAHGPDEGFTWALTLSREGLASRGDGGPAFRACAPVEPGTFRFVYWGIAPAAERERDVEYALGREFTVTA